MLKQLQWILSQEGNPTPTDDADHPGRIVPTSFAGAGTLESIMSDYGNFLRSIEQALDQGDERQLQFALKGTKTLTTYLRTRAKHHNAKHPDHPVDPDTLPIPVDTKRQLDKIAKELRACSSVDSPMQKDTHRCIEQLLTQGNDLLETYREELE